MDTKCPKTTSIKNNKEIIIEVIKNISSQSLINLYYIINILKNDNELIFKGFYLTFTSTKLKDDI